MSLGLFYQSGYRITACYHALAQFRKHYPTAPIAFYEDNTDILRPVADKFGCVYGRTDKQGYNDANSGRPAFDLETTMAWLNRVREACETTLKDVDWVVHFEDDVWFKAPLVGQPPFDLSSIGGRSMHENFYKYVGFDGWRGTYGCGGSVFSRNKFLYAYDIAKQADWRVLVDLFAGGEVTGPYPAPSMWTDAALTAVFMLAKCRVGLWDQLRQYTHSNIPHMDDRAGWPGTIAELEAEQPAGVNVIHCWKPYYYPTAEEQQAVLDALNHQVQNETHTGLRRRRANLRRRGQSCRIDGVGNRADNENPRLGDFISRRYGWRRSVAVGCA